MRRQAALRATGLDANRRTGGIELLKGKGTVTGNALVKAVPMRAIRTSIPVPRGRRGCFSRGASGAGARSSQNSSGTGRIPTSPACVTAAVRARIGEVRGGEVLSLLEAWNAGHPGGVCTVHANHARAGLRRIEQLIAENEPNPDAGTDRRSGEPDRVHRTRDSNLGS
jgi:Type II/IV secretion system protein